MDCPKCGSSLETYRLFDREAVSCESCGYVGVETEHGGLTAGPEESWEDALARFRRQSSSLDVSTEEA